MKSIDNLIETLNVVHIIKSCRGIPNLQYEYGAHIRQERVRPCQAYNHHRTKEKLLDTLGQEPIHQPDIICMLKLIILISGPTNGNDFVRLTTMHNTRRLCGI